MIGLEGVGPDAVGALALQTPVDLGTPDDARRRYEDRRQDTLRSDESFVERAVGRSHGYSSFSRIDYSVDVGTKPRITSCIQTS
jgi:hypothetical protein